MAKIGLEVHGYLLTKEKLFCDCKSEHGTKMAKPNVNICPICTGIPGSKPMTPNNKAIRKIIQIGLVLKCKINEKLVWQRKHYNWPDLPKGFQSTISGAYAIPVGTNGKFEGIRIKEVHIEEDPAAWNPLTGEIDYNRSGSPLVEIVTEPDFKDEEQVTEWLKQLLLTLGYIKVLDKNQGIKADVNISLPELNGKRVEIKNVNSISNIERAIINEIKRQKQEVPNKEETRAFIESTGETKMMRTKEQAADYRFISEPDLPIIKISKKQIEDAKKTIPETPQIKLKKLIKKHKIPKKSAEVLTKKLDIVEFFEKVIKEIKPSLAIPWVTKELMGVLNYSKKELDEIEFDVEHFIELLKLVEEKTITELKAQEILRKFVPKSFSPKEYAKENKKISNKGEIQNIVEQVIKENPKAVNDYKQGQQNAINFLIGKVMQSTQKRADYQTAKKELDRILKK